MSGEKQGDRAVMDRNVKDMVASGLTHQKAKQMARESMIRCDRKLREQGQR